MKQFSSTIPEGVDLLAAVMAWLPQFSKSFVLVNNEHTHDAYHRTDLLVGAGAWHVCQPETNLFATWNKWTQEHEGYSFGFISYDAKNDIEALTSSHPDGVGFPLLGWMMPMIVIEQASDTVTISVQEGDAEAVWQQLLGALPGKVWQAPKVSLSCNMSKDDYLDTVRRLQEHIAAGDIYEVNLCVEWWADKVDLDPYLCFTAFNGIGKAPFAAFVRWDDCYLLSQSPERFLACRGCDLISQPIKGTVKRGRTEEEDEALKTWLQGHPKERAENVMIVDLVRNDLAKSAVTGSVQVPELFGIYSFQTVHQMISTVTASKLPSVTIPEAVRDAFPMGSMTGAPKVKSMELIEQYERSRRGLFSGTIGYVAPNGDFDSNVVIRSIAYNRTTGYLSYQTGGAITWDAIPEQEYEELLLKRTVLDRLFSIKP